MKKSYLGGLLAFALLAGLSAVSQEATMAGNVGRVYFSKPMPGHVTQYLEASKTHTEFHRSKKDPWTWYVWEIVSGAESGQYLIGTFWHKWGDFDNPPVAVSEDNADYLKSVAPHEASWRGEHVVYMPEHSYPPDGMTTIRPVYVLYRMKIKPGMAEAYLNAVKKIPEAARKAEVRWRYTFWRVADGGSVPSFYVSVPFSSWAERGDQGSPFEEILAKAYGRGEAHAILHTFDKAVEYETSMVLEYRPELSYVPASK